MRYLTLATDYDGTLATHGVVTPETLAAMRRLIASGRSLVLVTGRELDDLLRVFPEASEMFARIVAENGAVLHRPKTGETKALVEAPPPAFAEALRARGVEPLFVGQVIVATLEPHQTTVLDVIRELGLELQVIFNKGSVMILPTGVNKETGLRAALAELGLSAHNAIAVGDAENDHAFLAASECGVAVANALPMLKARADLVMTKEEGAGVVELMERVLADDLESAGDRLLRHHVALGTTAGQGALRLSPYGRNLLVSGPARSGKSSLTARLLEQLVDARYQCCVLDSEGVHHELAAFVQLGHAEAKPTVDEVMQLLERPEEHAVVNLVGLPLRERSRFGAELLSRLLELRARSGRPHAIVLDEAHQLFPSEGELAPSRALCGLVLVTARPESVSRALLGVVDEVIAVGDAPHRTFESVARAMGAKPPAQTSATSDERAETRGRAMFWDRTKGEPPVRFRLLEGAPKGSSRATRASTSERA